MNARHLDESLSTSSRLLTSSETFLNSRLSRSLIGRGAAVAAAVVPQPSVFYSAPSFFSRALASYFALCWRSSSGRVRCVAVLYALQLCRNSFAKSARAALARENAAAPPGLAAPLVGERLLYATLERPAAVLVA
eukprot:scaffold46291_cov67-Phaeocystis_antarctica.AAC.10